ncbi:lipoprotein insertase outer membrane protein LolB [Thalassotalea fusca]
MNAYSFALKPTKRPVKTAKSVSGRLLRSYTKVFCTVILLSLTACSSLPEFSSSKPTIVYSPSNHNAYLTQLTNWQVTGKIALINKHSRESASLFWQNQPYKQQEKLALTTYLGINVLSIERNKKQYQITFNDETHEHHDLEYLLWGVSGYQLPAKALKNWLKGLPNSKKDKVTLVKGKETPYEIISHYKGLTWVIHYQSFMDVDGVPLPQKISIKQNNLTIKLSINQWII